MACNGRKMGSIHLFWHPKWSRIIFGKTLACLPNLVGPPWTSKRVIKPKLVPLALGP